MYFIVLLVISFGLIDWPVWLGVTLGTTESYLFIVALVSTFIVARYLLKPGLYTFNNSALRSILVVSIMVFIVELIYAVMANTSWVVAAYSSLTVLLLILLSSQRLSYIQYYGVLANLYWFLSLVQFVVLVLAFVDFDGFSSLLVNASEGIERKMVLYGSDSMYSYRHIGPYYFSAITNRPIFGDYGIIGFSREPHLSFTVMLVLSAYAYMKHTSAYVRFLVVISFLPSLLYYSDSNLAALILGGLVFISMTYLNYVRKNAVLLFVLGPFVLVMLGVIAYYTIGNILSVQYSDRSISESLDNIFRLSKPTLIGTGLADVYSRSNLHPDQLGILPLMLYIGYVYVLLKVIMRAIGAKLWNEALLICYLLVYSFKLATVFIFLPIIAAVVVMCLYRLEMEVKSRALP